MASIPASKSILRQHFIPMRRDLWSIDSFEEFTEERANLIKDFIKDRYPDIYRESGSN
jgi:HEPN domain-containing protein